MSCADRDRLTSFNTSIAALAVFLLVAPWVWGYSDLPVAAWNAWLSSAAILGFSVLVFVQPSARAEVAQFLGGLWAVIAPWALGFSSDAQAFWTHACVGMGIIGFALAEAWLLHSGSSSGGPLTA